MGLGIDNLLPLHGRLNRHQYAGWTPSRFADQGLGCHLDADVGVVMRDGTRLSADVYRPKKSGRYPAIVQIGAYNKEMHSAGMPKGSNEVGSPPVITDRGYVQVLASRRGMGRSRGVSGEFWSEQEISDYEEAIAWAAEQPWCDGRVCLFGTSYYGMIQPLVAVRQPPALAAMFAHEICTDFYRHVTNYGGTINNRFFALWLGANFKDEDFTATASPLERAALSQVMNRAWLWDDVIHPRVKQIYEGHMGLEPSREMRAFFARLVASAKSRGDLPVGEGSFRHLDRLVTPFVAVHNAAQWNIHQFGEFDLWHRAATPEDRKWLIVSEHEYELPVLSWQLEALAFFDHVVKGCDNGYAEQARVRYWVDGAQRYEGAKSFPPPAARRTRLHLSGGAEGEGALGAAVPSGGERTWTAVPPSTPLPEGIDEVMPQKLRYTLPFTRETTLAGAVTVSLSFSCNEIDSFVVAALSRLDAEGKRHLLSMGAMRPAQRRVDEALSSPYEVVMLDRPIEPLVPGERVTLRFSLVPTAARFQPGEKLLLEIASRTALVRGDISDAYVHFDLEVPPYFSQNRIHHGADTFVEVDLTP